MCSADPAVYCNTTVGSLCAPKCRGRAEQKSVAHASCYELPTDAPAVLGPHWVDDSTLVANAQCASPATYASEEGGARFSDLGSVEVSGNKLSFTCAACPEKCFTPDTPTEKWMSGCCTGIREANSRGKAIEEKLDAVCGKKKATECLTTPMCVAKSPDELVAVEECPKVLTEERCTDPTPGSYGDYCDWLTYGCQIDPSQCCSNDCADFSCHAVSGSDSSVCANIGTVDDCMRASGCQWQSTGAGECSDPRCNRLTGCCEKDAGGCAGALVRIDNKGLRNKTHAPVSGSLSDCHQSCINRKRGADGRGGPTCNSFMFSDDGCTLGLGDDGIKKNREEEGASIFVLQNRVFCTGWQSGSTYACEQIEDLAECMDADVCVPNPASPVNPAAKSFCAEQKNETACTGDNNPSSDWCVWKVKGCTFRVTGV